VGEILGFALRLGVATLLTVGVLSAARRARVLARWAGVLTPEDQRFLASRLGGPLATGVTARTVVPPANARAVARAPAGTLASQP